MSSEPSPTNSTAPASGRRTILGIIVHLTGVFFGLFGAGIVYLVSNSSFTNENARNAVNWQLLVTGVVIVAAVVAFGLGTVSDWAAIIAAFGAVAVLILNLLFCGIATLKAAGGEAWTYPGAPKIL
jgi:uncharacterized Tic20 family protein